MPEKLDLLNSTSIPNQDDLEWDRSQDFNIPSDNTPTNFHTAIK